MLALLVTLAAEAIAIPAAIVARMQVPQAGTGLVAGQVASLFLFVALVTGLVGAALMPVVRRVRAEPPPRAITIAVLVAAAIPPVTILIRWLL